MDEGFKPKHKFDKEYRCTYPLEMCWLTDNGIRYEFVKTEDNGRLTVWKYKKTRKLALALADFWASKENH